jgi:4-hydroxybenzoate polyprenyltransferase
MSPTDLVVRYLAERGRLRTLVPLAVALAVVGWLVASPDHVSAARLVGAVAHAFALIIAFRVWDDLEDRERDAREHPRRITVVAERVAPLVALGVFAATIGVGGALLSTGAAFRLVTLSATTLALWIWYRARPPVSPAILSGHVLLLKYPAIAVVASPVALDATNLTHAAAPLLAVYLGISVFEFFDDPTLRASAAARGVAIAESVLLVSLITASASFLGTGIP